MNRTYQNPRSAYIEIDGGADPAAYRLSDFPPRYRAFMAAVLNANGEGPAGAAENFRQSEPEIFEEFFSLDPDQEFTNGIEGIPTYPVEAFTGPARRLIEEAAESLGADPAMVGSPLLAYAGGTIGRTACLELKPGYVQYPIVWVVVVGDSGEGKSPAKGFARYGMNALQAAAKERHERDLQQFEMDFAAWNDAPRGERGPKPVRPELEHFYSTDTTPEGMARILDKSPGVTLDRDEFIGFLKALDQYKGGRGSERQTHLSAWSGESIKIDRKGSDPIIIEHPVACLVGGLQPALLPELQSEAGQGDGFLPRVLFTVAVPGLGEWSERTVSPATLRGVEALFRQLRRDERVVRLSAPARELWRDYFNDARERYSVSAEPMKSMLAKADQHLARIALILHELSGGGESLQPDVMLSAISLVEYHLACGRYIFQLLGSPLSTGRPGGLAARLVSILGDDWKPLKEINRALGGHEPARTRDAALSALEAAGLAESRQGETDPERGGRPSVEWRLLHRDRSDLSRSNPLDQQAIDEAFTAELGGVR